jgi:hypothetical protein
MILADCPVWTVELGVIMDVNTTEVILRLLTLAEKAIDDGKTITIKADEITINKDGGTASCPEIVIE